MGWVSPLSLSLADVLGEESLAELRMLSHQHEDGWGMAWWQDDQLHSFRSPLPAHSCPEYQAVIRTVRSDAAMLHLRWATPGLAVAPENTHPFVSGDWAFGHNGAVRPADGLLPLLEPEALAQLRGDTDSERLLHLLLSRMGRHGFEAGLRRTVEDVCRDLTPSSLNSLLLGREGLTAICSHGAASEGEAPILEGPPEDQPGYFDLRWRQQDGAVVVASEALGSAGWSRMPNGTALVISRGSTTAKSVQIGAFPPQTVERERRRREAAATSGAA